MSLVTIPALTTIVDRQFQEYRTLCPVQALRYYFIALKHAIKWTIANPVGADRPAKRQTKMSCVSTGWKYLRFHVQGRTYQFKPLPFGLSTAPMEFTVVAKEVKLMAIHKGIRIHQYLDDWFVESQVPPSLSPAYTGFSRMCQDKCWPVNLDKSELEPKQVFNFVGYQFDLRSGRV